MTYENRCKGCGEHIADPHAPGCPIEIEAARNLASKLDTNLIPAPLRSKMLLAIADAYDEAINADQLHTVEDARRIATKVATATKDEALAAGWSREAAFLAGYCVVALAAELLAEMVKATQRTS